MHKVAVKKSDCSIEFFCLLVLPLAPLIRVHVVCGYTFSTVLEDVQVVAASLFWIPDLFEGGRGVNRSFQETPVAQPVRVISMILRVATRGEVKQDAPL